MIHGYLRVSTVEQAADGTSLAEQERRIRALAGPETPLKIWRDDGVSGSVALLQRPAGRLMDGQMQPGDVVMASRLDRLFRSTADALTTTDEWKKRNVEVVALDFGTEPILSGLTGKLFFTLLAAFAEFERGRIRERILEGKTAKSKRGGQIGQVPYGFRAVGNGKDAMIEVDEGEMWVIGQARRLSVTGKGWVKIANALNKEGFRNRAGNPIQPRQIGRMLAQKLHEAETTANRPQTQASQEPDAETLAQKRALRRLRQIYKGDRLALRVVNAQTPKGYDDAVEALVRARSRAEADSIKKRAAEVFAAEAKG